MIYTKINRRYFIITFISLIIAIFTILIMIEFEKESDKINIVMIEERNSVESVAKIIKSDLNSRVTDLFFIRDIFEENYDDLEHSFVTTETFLRAKKIYYHARYIDRFGKEIFRVNFQDGKSYTVSKENLQDKSDRYYVRDIEKIKYNEVYLSRLDLNKEHGVVETPFKPVIRLSTKLSENKGSIVLNYLAKNTLDKIQEFNLSTKGNIYILNIEGDYVFSANKKFDFAFMFDSINESFKEDYPSIWTSIDDNKIIVNEKGLFTIERISINSETKEVKGVVSSESTWYIVSQLPRESEYVNYIYNDRVEIVIKILSENYGMLLIILIISLFVAYLKNKNDFKDKAVNKVLRLISRLEWEEHNDDFLSDFVKILANELSMKYAFVTEIIDNNRARTLALYAENSIVDNIEYEFADTPCEFVYGKKLCCYPKNVQALFPKAKFLCEVNASSYIATPLFDSDGNAIGLVGLIDDEPIGNQEEIEMLLKLIVVKIAKEIEKHKYEKLLKEALLFNKTIINSLSEGVIVYDLNLNFIEWNSYMEKLTSRKKDEVIGKNAASVFPILLENGMYEHWQKTVQSGIETMVEFEYTNELSGEKYWLQDSNKHLINDAGEIVGIIVSVVDVTSYKMNAIELKRSKEFSDQNAEAQKRFMANMSHEIRTPMNGLLGMIDLTLMSDLDEEEKSNLMVAKSSGKVLLQVINDILDYSKIEADGVVIDEEDVDIRKLMFDIYDIFKVAAEQKKLSMDIDIDSKVPKIIKCDRLRIRQVISNLVGNAVKFTEVGNVIERLELIEKDEKYVLLRFIVSDTGIGISEEEGKLLFNRFTQADNTVTRKYGGSGLGLSISKGLVELMGGSLDYSSISGEGSEFYFTIKLEYSEDVLIEEKVENIVSKKLTYTKKDILIVDDDLVSRNLLEKYISRKGFVCKLAENGEKAIALYLKGDFDMILMDISMPIINGSKATDIIKKSDKYLECQIPIVAQTAFSMDGDKQKYIALNFDDYISKPIDYDAIDTLLEEWFN